MMNHKRPLISAGLCAVAIAAVALTLGGCKGEDQTPVAVNTAPPPPPPAPPAPAVTPIEQLMLDLNIDQRVVLPEEKAPNNNIDRKAVLVFFDAMARGNWQSLKGMLPLAEQAELNALVNSGAWQETVAHIRRVEIQTGNNALNQKCALAVIEVDSGFDLVFQPQLWYYTTDGEEALFEAAPSPPGILDKLSGDWIASWHQILQAEIELAEKPDEDVTLAQKNLDSEPASQSGGAIQRDGDAGGAGVRNAPQRAPG